MFVRQLGFALLVAITAFGAEARTRSEGRESAQNQGQRQNQGQSQRSGWFGQRPTTQPSGQPQPGYGERQPTSYPEGYSRTPVQAQPGQDSRSSIYPGLPESSRRSPRLSPPSSSQPSTGYPTNAHSPRVGESRRDYEARIKQSPGKAPDNAPSTAVPYYGSKRTYPAPATETINPAAPRTPSSRLAVPRVTPPSESSPGVSRTEANPAADRMRSRLEEGYARSSQNPSGSVEVDFQQAQQRLEKALQRGDYDTVQRETDALRSRFNSLKQQKDTMEIDDKLAIISAAPMAEEALENLSEGHRTRQDSKIRMGIQKLGKASKDSKSPSRR